MDTSEQYLENIIAVERLICAEIEKIEIALNDIVTSGERRELTTKKMIYYQQLSIVNTQITQTIQHSYLIDGPESHYYEKIKTRLSQIKQQTTKNCTAREIIDQVSETLYLIVKKN